VLSGEHGIGCCKRPHMPRMFSPEELETMWRVREAFDPELRCNPGKVLPDREGGQARPAAAEVSRPGRPEGPEDVAALLAAASREGRQVLLRGAGTKSAPVSEDVEVVELVGLDRIVSYNHANLTITAQAGATLAQIDAACAERGQMLPLRPRYWDRATIGGVLATAETGPQRLLYGGPRDLVTGLQAALPNGELVRFGGSCVKNVAGYAVEKLLIGSRGSLGAIVEATLRTLPRPEACRTLSLGIEQSVALGEFLSELLRGPLRPAALELIWPGRDNRWTLLVGLEGFAEDVDQMAQWLARMAGTHGLSGFAEVTGDYDALWASVVEMRWDGIGASGGGLQSPPAAAVMKASCIVSETTGLAAGLAELEGLMALRAAPGLGLVHCALSEGADILSAEQLAMRLSSRYSGSVTWLCPTPAQAKSGPAGVAGEVCRRLKDALDPHAILPPLR